MKTVRIVEAIERLEDFPVRDEAYLVGRVEDGRYFFAWGSRYPYTDELPAADVPDGESGVSFHTSAEEAMEALRAAVDAVKATENVDMGDRICPDCGTVDLVEEGLYKWKCLRCGEIYDEEWIDAAEGFDD